MECVGVGSNPDSPVAHPPETNAQRSADDAKEMRRVKSRRLIIESFSGEMIEFEIDCGTRLSRRSESYPFVTMGAGIVAPHLRVEQQVEVDASATCKQR
ncbi:MULTISPECIES: hypothetical protein [Methylosinus]|uniref:hypothetical protein n=1 Tax=Methylosinus TaxID=425 RepID=UPI00058B91F6|nr:MULTISPECIES: hypothetical protein [Methylosinus]OBS50484.1 hypothetical protein A8B73_21225 [Methylosinus sp. 3S-1]